MNENIYRTPEANLDTHQHPLQNVKLWNPDAAGAWSLLFTPVFGSILVHKNWQSIGNAEEEKTSKRWIYLSILMAIVSTIINLAGFVYIIAWYFSSQKKQTTYIKEKLGGNYTRKGWLVPLSYAFMAWMALIFGIFSFFWTTF